MVAALPLLVPSALACVSLAVISTLRLRRWWLRVIMFPMWGTFIHNTRSIKHHCSRTAYFLLEKWKNGRSITSTGACSEERLVFAWSNGSLELTAASLIGTSSASKIITLAMATKHAAKTRRTTISLTSGKIIKTRGSNTVGNAHIATSSKTNSRLSSRVAFRHKLIVQAPILTTKGVKRIAMNNRVAAIINKELVVISSPSITLRNNHSNISTNLRSMLRHMATSSNLIKVTLQDKRCHKILSWAINSLINMPIHSTLIINSRILNGTSRTPQTVVVGVAIGEVTIAEKGHNKTVARTIDLDQIIDSRAC